MDNGTFITTRTIFSPQIALVFPGIRGKRLFVTGKHIWKSNLNIQSYRSNKQPWKPRILCSWHRHIQCTGSILLVAPFGVFSFSVLVSSAFWNFFAKFKPGS